MKILLGHNYYCQRGGEDQVAEEEIELLKSRGHEVFLYTQNNTALNNQTILERTSRINELYWSKPSYEDVRRLIQRHQPDIAHFHNIYYMLTPSVYQACEDEGVPVVQTVHNYRMTCLNGLFFRRGRVCEECSAGSFKSGIRHGCFQDSKLKSLFLARNLKKYWQNRIWMTKVRRFIALSEFSRKKFVHMGLPAEKIDVKINSCSVKNDIEEKGGGYALFIGRLSGEKGVDFLAQAWRQIPNLPLKVIGDGPLSDTLKHQAPAHVKWLGQLSHEEAMQHLRKADILIAPSLCYEHFPRVVVEALSYGVPVIASQLGSIPELIEPGVSGFLFEPQNTQGLVSAVEQWAQCDQTKMRQGALSRFKNSYTEDINYHQLLKIYEKCI